MSSRWSPSARDDLLGAVAWYTEHAPPEVADRFLDEVDAAVSMLIDGRFDGPIAP